MISVLAIPVYVQEDWNSFRLPSTIMKFLELEKFGLLCQTMNGKAIWEVAHNMNR